MSARCPPTCAGCWWSGPTTTGDFAGAGWRTPDGDALLREHAAFVAVLDGLGVEVVVADAPEGMVDACFAYDPVFVTGAGAIELRMVKPARRDEPAFLAAEVEKAGVPVIGRLTGAATADGGDMCWLDETTLAVGRSYRTNAAAHDQLAEILGREGVTVERADLPHHLGAGHVMHLMSVVSPVAPDLAVVFEPLAPVPLLELLAERGYRTVAGRPGRARRPGLQRARRPARRRGDGRRRAAHPGRARGRRRRGAHLPRGRGQQGRRRPHLPDPPPAARLTGRAQGPDPAVVQRPCRRATPGRASWVDERRQQR